MLSHGRPVFVFRQVKITMIRFAVFIALMVSIPALAVGDDKTDTYLLHATKLEFDGLHVAYVVTSLRGPDLVKNLPARLIALCHSNDHLDKYRISVYADSESAEFVMKKRGSLPDTGDEEWQRADQAILAAYNHYDGVLSFLQRKGDSELITTKQMQLGKSWCQR